MPSIGGNSVQERPDPRKQCAVAALILLICGIFASRLGEIYVEPGDSGLGARGLPLTLLGAGTLLAAALLVRNLFPALRMLQSAGSHGGFGSAGRVALLAAISFGYVWAITLFQYAIPTAVVMSALLYLFGTRGWIRLTGIPVIAVAVYYFVFFILLGIFEEPGHLLEYDSYTFALRARQFLGLQ